MPITELTDNARVVIENRIAQKNEHGVRTETAEDVFERVARNISLGSEEDYESFLEMLSSLKFLPNSPTLVNAGRDLQQLSACFVIPVEDSMEGIFEAVKQAAMIHKSGGGTGFSFSRLRPAEAKVSSTRGIASGPVSFMEVFNKATDVIKQGGTRRGANMGILRVDHPDIMQFIEAKSSDGELANFNISVAITDEFMDALEKDAEYELKWGHESYGMVSATAVFNRIIENAWKTGDPGVVFIDRINQSKANPVPMLGPVESTNPCGEQPLYPWDSCNLGSINLSKFVKDGKFNTPELVGTVHTAVKFLDNVITANKWPNINVEEVSTGIRRIGLGVMGWADALIALKVRYGSQESIALAKYIMSTISRTADEASRALALSRGAFPMVENSIYSAHPIRNATRTTIAPTGTISIIAGCSSGIEPLFALEYTRSHYLDENDPSKRKELIERHPAWEAWVNAQKGPAPDYLITANEVTVREHIEMQAAFQEFTDNAVSKTINMPASATVKDVKDAYMLAWELGCLGVTIYRDGSRDNQVLTKAGNEVKTEPVAIDMTGRIINKTRGGIVHKVEIDAFEGYIIIGTDASGNPVDCFILGNKTGTATRGYLDTIGILISTLLRNNVSVIDIANKLQGIKFEPSGLTGNKDIRHASSIVDYLASFLKFTFVDGGINSSVEPSGDNCHQCGSQLYHESGCLTCISCGWSKCG